MVGPWQPGQELHLPLGRGEAPPSRPHRRPSGLARVALAALPVRQIAAARLAASFRSAATASMLGVLEETAGELGPQFTPTG
jgi:hypothetical protein